MNFEQIFMENMNIAINGFNFVYPSFNDKIKFVKQLHESTNFIESHSQKEVLMKSMELLVENAKITETRKLQQKYIMPVLASMFQNVSLEDLLNQFKNDPNSFTIFCITAMSFKYEKTMKEHGETHHKQIIEVLDKYTSMIANLENF